MAFFTNWFKKPETAENSADVDPETRRIRNDLAREKAAVARKRMEMELERAKIENEIEKIELDARLERAKQELAELRGDFDDDDDGDDDNPLISSLLNALFLKMNSPTGQQTQVTPTYTPTQTATVEPVGNSAILEKWQSLPPIARLQAKSMTDEQIRTFLISQKNDITPDEIQQVIQVVRSQP